MKAITNSIKTNNQIKYGEKFMREFNALGGYPQPKERVVGPHIRTIQNKITASYRDAR